MNKRLEIIYSEMPESESFADVGCDHGYIAKAVLDGKKSPFVIISDISAPSLKKAERLLKRYIDLGSAKAVVCDGLKGVPPCQTVLIAGMGGEEIIKILSESPFMPKQLLLSPMKTQDKVRRFLQENGYGITKDYTFFDRRFYHLIYAEYGRKVEEYTESEYIYGRTNLTEKREDFIGYIKKELEKAENYRQKVVGESAEQFDKKIQSLKEILNANK